MKTEKPKPHNQFQLPPQVFDAYNKETPIQQALGSNRVQGKIEQADLRSVNYVPGVSGYRFTPTGVEVASFTFPSGSIPLTVIQNISTDKILGRDTAGSGVIEELGLGAGLSISGGNLVNTVSAYTDEQAQDAVGGMVDVTLTYNDSTPSLGVTAAYRRKSLFDHFANVGNVGTGEDDLISDTIVAGQLANNGEKLEAQYAGSFVSSATATRQIRAYFGGTLIFDTGALTLSLSSAWDIYLTVIRVSASVVRCSVSLTTQGAALSAYTACTEVTGLTLSNTQVLKVTGEAAGVGAATNDIVAKMSFVEWLAAA
jgi:hypothetical protein